MTLSSSSNPVAQSTQVSTTAVKEFREWRVVMDIKIGNKVFPITVRFADLMSASLAGFLEGGVLGAIALPVEYVNGKPV